MQFTLKDRLSSETIVIEADMESFGINDDHTVMSGVSGFFGTLGEDFAGLFAHCGRLFLLIGGKMFEPDSSCQFSYSREGNRRCLVVHDGKEEFRIEYTSTEWPVSTPYYSEDEEDVDFGLWLCNVLNSAERRSIILESWKGGVPVG